MPQDSTTADLDELVRKAKAIRARHEPTWYLNLAYLAGQQWIYWNRGRLYEPRLDPHRVTFTDNRLIGIVRTEVAKMTKQRPVFQCTPTTGRQEDVEAARLGERMLTHLFDKLDLSRKQRSAVSWSRATGAGFWKLYWDSQAGEHQKVLVGPDGQAIMGQDGRPMDPSLLEQLPPEMVEGLQVRDIATGECCVEVRSPLEMLVDPLAGDEGLRSAEWLIEDCVRSKEYVQSRYDIDLKEDADAIAGVAESRMGGWMGSDTDTSSYKGVRIFEYWAPRSSSNPEGKRCAWAQGQVLEEGANDYVHLPYVMFSGIPVPGRFWPTSTVEQCRPVQDELNKTESQVRENAARIGNPSMLKSRMANVEYHGVPGEVIEYDDTMPNSSPGVPAAAGDAGLRPGADRPHAVLAGRHLRPARGHAGPGAARRHRRLGDQPAAGAGRHQARPRDHRHGALDRRVRHDAAADRRQLLRRARTIHIAGEDGDVGHLRVQGLDAARDHARRRCRPARRSRSSKAAKQANMQSLLTLFIQNGMPLQRRELNRFLKDMEVGGYERLVEQFSVDEEQINAEHRHLAQGMLLPINAYDNDEAHVDGHQEFQKGSRYQNLEPPVQMVFEQHVEFHRQRLALLAEQQMEQQIEMERALHPPAQPSSNGKPTASSTTGG